jgi:hypothetical protein
VGSGSHENDAMVDVVVVQSRRGKASPSAKTRSEKTVSFSIVPLPCAALAAQQVERLHVLRAGSYQLDAVYLDAYGAAPQAEPWVCQYILC